MAFSWIKQLKVTKVGQLVTSRNFKRSLIGIFFFLAFSFIISVDFLPEQIPFTEGQVAPRDIDSPKSIEFVDQIATEELRNKAAQTILPVYDLDANVTDLVLKNVDRVFEQIKEVNSQQGLEQKAKVDLLRENVVLRLPEDVLNYVADLNQSSLDEIQTTTTAILRQALAEGIEEDKLETYKEQLNVAVSELNISKDAKQLISLLITNYLQPNKVYNEVETSKRKIAARNSVTPVTKTILRNQTIIRKGDIVSADTIQKLTAVGLYRQESSWQVIVGIMLMTAVSIIVVLFYLKQFRPDIFEKDKLLVLIGIISFTTIIISKLVLAIYFEDYPTVSAQFGYVAPVAAASMLVAILIDAHLAVIVTVLLSAWVGILANGELRFFVVGVITGFVAIFSVARLNQRSDLAKAGFLYVGFSAVITILSIGWINNMETSALFIIAIGMGLMNGVLSAVLTGGFLPYLESVFGITSAVKLLEISNPNHPLLKRLLLEAPGTYHHSIVVGNLAEAAANEIGAEPLLVRAGAYFHDVGKIKRPYFFIENQLTTENPHDKISPSLSTLIITSHPKDGVDLAKEYKVPEVVIDLISQHHGTQLVSYFYHKAKENDKNETVLDSDYRYEGAKPQTREAALIMLSDSVEAAVRALKAPTMGRVEGLVRQIIKDKLVDGQLDECDITFKELDLTAQAFMRVLSGIFHNRIEYPDQMIKEIERRKAKDANAR